jgi:hypothetical protein
MNEDRITPIRYKSKRQVKRPSLVGINTYESAYNLRVNKIKPTRINSYVTFYR